jgi:hypothetical protein
MGVLFRLHVCLGLPVCCVLFFYVVRVFFVILLCLHQVLAHAAKLHPVRIEHLPLSDRDHITQVFEGRLTRLLADPVARARYRLDEQPLLDVVTLLRLVMVVHCNGFASGLYLHLAIVNHSCRPNCIKFTPPSASGASLGVIRVCVCV